MAENDSKRSSQVPDSATGLLIGAGTGTAVGVAATAAVVPIVQAVGFTTSGIAAGSAAAGMMASAATAGGGGVASGSAVAVLQSIGATAAIPAALAATTVVASGAVGLGVAAIVKTCRSFQNEYQSAYEPRNHEDRGKYWLIATEEGCGNVRVCRYSDECAARKAFDGIWCSRILYSPDDKKVKCAGWNGWALATIRRVMTEHYLTG
ncbi:unnamed protein product [Phytophthora lilii]|uniref:Unnamed protein product n=1 Tax=Phytophthora lilii TaxID=2077276 RepID=A0A9W6XJZ4_9STRA|nr:unnamed protein product [Phytophthora lilii]